MKGFGKWTVCFVALGFVPVCFAQNITDVEVKPYGSYVGGPVDQVDLATGNLFLNIPLVSYPQLGKLPPLSFSIGLNNAPYSIDLLCPDGGVCSYTPNRYDPSPPGSISHGGMNAGALENAKLGAYITSSFEGGLAAGQYVFSEDCDLIGSICAAGITYRVIDPGGNTHELGSDNSRPPSSWNAYRAMDGTGYTFIPSFASTNQDGTSGNAYDPSNLSNIGLGCCNQASLPSWTYWLPSNYSTDSNDGLHAGTTFSPTGIQYTTQFVTEPQLPPLPNGSPSRLVVTTETDPSGVNSVTRGPWYWTDIPVTAASISAFYGASTANYPVYTDSQGHRIPDIISLQETIVAGAGADPRCPTIAGQAPVASLPWGPPGPQGSTLSYLICYVQLNLTYDWAEDPTFPTSNSIWETGYAIQSIVLPDQKSYWGFAYDQSARCAGVPCGSGDVLEVILPTGGSISYAYGNIGTDTDGEESRCTSVTGRCHVVVSRTENDGTRDVSKTTYSYASISNAPNSGPITYTTTETTSGNDIVHTFSELGSTIGYHIALVTNQLFETETDYYQGSVTASGCSAGSNCLRSVSTTYDTNWDIPSPEYVSYNGGWADATRIVNAVPDTTTTHNLAANTYTEKVNKSYATVFSAVGITCGWNNNLQTKTCNPMTVGVPTTESGFFDEDNYTATIRYISPTEVETDGPTGGCPVCWLQTTVTSFELNSSTNSAYLSKNIIALPVSIQNTGFNGNPIYSQTTYGYDPGGSGNLTSVSRLNTTGTNVSTSISYNPQGMPNLITDANQNQTKTTSFQCAGLYPQSITTAFGSTTTLPETTNYAYDCYTGAMTAVTDPNGVQTNYIYTSDPLGRLTQTQYGILNNSSPRSTTTFSYPSMTVASVAQDQVTLHDGNVTSTTTYDGLGRVIKQMNSAGYYVCTTYNATGQIATVSNPVSSCPASSSNLIAYNYDPLGRLIKETEQDGSILWWCYDGLRDVNYPQPQGLCSAAPSSTNAVAVSWTIPVAVSWVDSVDEAGIHRQQVTDALGQIIASVELNPQTGMLGLETDYTYDHNGNVTGVAQLGAGTANGDSAVTRAFVYDSLSRLTKSCNPETLPTVTTSPFCDGVTNWSLQYSYDGNGNMTTRTDARGVTTKYTYDALNRITGKDYAGQTVHSSFGSASRWIASAAVSPPVTYYYDGNNDLNNQGTSYSSYVGQAYSIGRRTGINDGAGTGAWDYDVMGRVAHSYRVTQDLLETYRYTYDLAGDVLTSPDGAFTYDNSGRAITGLGIDGVMYAPNGAMTNINRYLMPTSIHNTVAVPLNSTYPTTAGNLAVSYQYNSRFQPTQIMTTLTAPVPNSAPVTTLLQNLNYGYTTSTATTPNNNGNIAFINDGLHPNRSQQFSYDSLNRLSGAWSCNGAPPTDGTPCGLTDNTLWGETYKIDNFGNLSQRNLIAGSGSVFNAAVVPGTNQLSVPGYSYDAMGNLLTESIAGFTYSYAYDAENRLFSVNNTVSYVYDGDGQRVVKRQPAGEQLYYYGIDGRVRHEDDDDGVDSADMTYFNGQMMTRYDEVDGSVYRASYPLYDHLGTARMVVDGFGNVLSDKDFYPFGGEGLQFAQPGNLTSYYGAPGGWPAALDPYKFTGYERDQETGLDYASARHYASSMGRFISPDPSGLALADPTNPQSFNLYSYVANNPLVNVDPSGLDGCTLEGIDESCSTLQMNEGAIQCPNNDCSLLNQSYSGKYGGSFSLLAGVNGYTWINNGNGEELDDSGAEEAGLGDFNGSLGFSFGSSGCGTNQRRFFDWLDNSTMRGMATDLSTTPTNIFTLAVKEGGWTKDALDHNIPLNNPFGVNRINKKGQAAGNIKYDNLQAAVKGWESNVVAAPFVKGKTDPGDFVDALLAHGYNTNTTPYRKAFMSISGSMPGHMVDCGVNQ